MSADPASTILQIRTGRTCQDLLVRVEMRFRSQMKQQPAWVAKCTSLWPVLKFLLSSASQWALARRLKFSHLIHSQAQSQGSRRRFGGIPNKTEDISFCSRNVRSSWPQSSKLLSISLHSAINTCCFLCLPSQKSLQTNLKWRRTQETPGQIYIP